MTSTDMRSLGRLGEPLRSTPGFRRRRRVGRPVAVVLATVAVALTWLGVTANRQVAAPAQPVQVAADVAASNRPVSTAASRSAAGGFAPFAQIDGLELTLPHDAPVAVGFHEADGPEALPLAPIGQLESDANPSGWTAVADQDGPGYHVLNPIAGARPGTGAVEVVVPQGGVAVAPVSGRVTAVTEYPLVAQTRDWRVVIAPEGRPDLIVDLRYIADPQVAVGEEVVAGKTVLGAARVLPFATPVDAVADAALPRVSLTVKPSTASEGIDPNAPAVSTTAGTS